MNVIGPHHRVLRAMRTRAGLTQAELGVLAGVNQARIANAEAGRAPLTAERWAQLGPALAFGNADSSPNRALGWLIACSASDEDTDSLRIMYDDSGQVGIFWDGSLAHRTCQQLAAMGLPWPFPLPTYADFAIEAVADATGEPGRWYAVDQISGDLSPEREALARATRATEYAGAVMRMLLTSGRVAVAL